MNRNDNKRNRGYRNDHDDHGRDYDNRPYDAGRDSYYDERDRFDDSNRGNYYRGHHDNRHDQRFRDEYEEDNSRNDYREGGRSQDYGSHYGLSDVGWSPSSFIGPGNYGRRGSLERDEHYEQGYRDDRGQESRQGGTFRNSGRSDWDYENRRRRNDEDDDERGNTHYSDNSPFTDPWL
jgi:hypothetical protein